MGLMNRYEKGKRDLPRIFQSDLWFLWLMLELVCTRGKGGGFEFTSC